MATDRTNIGYKFENGDIPSQGDFQEVFNSFIHKDEDKADFQMVEVGSDNQHYVTPALLYTGLKNIGIITGNNYVPYKEQFDNFIGNSLPLKYPPVRYSVKAFKNGQLLFEREGEGNEGDYIINYDNAVITFSSDIDKRNIEVAYWYKNLSPNTGGGSGGQQIDFTNFLHTSGNETKNGILTFNNTTPTPTSGIVLTNSGADAGAKVLDVTVSGAGSGISVQNTATGTGIKLSNSGAGTGVQLNSTATATGDPLKVTKDNVVKAKIDSEGIVSAEKFVSARGQRTEFVKGDGFLDPTTYAEDNKVIHIEGNEERDGALKLTHDDSVEDVLTIEKKNSANCLKLVQNSTSNATTSTFYTSTDNVNRKAISIQKKEQENAFITHDGNVSGTSFTTLNEKADITDGFLTLAASTSPTAMAGHAKLYAKTAGTTDFYVMGSDGVEKKIGGEVDLSAYAKKESPSFSGTPTAPTPAAGTNTTQIATTAFVQGAYVSLTANQGISGIKSFYGSFTTFNSISVNTTATVGSNLSVGSTLNFSTPSFGLGYANSTGNPEIGRINNSIGIYSGGTNYVAELITSSITGGHKAFTFPNKSGTFALLSDITTSVEPSQITITTSTSITTDTLDTNSKKQLGKNVIINNGTSAINITVNGGTDFCASYLKHGTGAITFVQASGRTLVQVNATAILNGAAGSTATISSIGTTDYLRISNV